MSLLLWSVTWPLPGLPRRASKSPVPDEIETEDEEILMVIVAMAD